MAVSIRNEIRSSLRNRLVWRVAQLLAVAIFSAGSFWPALPAIASEREMSLPYNETFIPRFPQKSRMIGRFIDEYEELRDRIFALNKKGQDPYCSEQILKEAGWLMKYTTRVEDAQRRFDDLRKSLEIADQDYVLEQDPKDGSWGHCFENWAWRLHESIDPFKELQVQGRKPKQRLGFLDPVDTPEEIHAVLQDLLVSDIESGYNKRKELNLVITALGQFYFFPELADMFPPDFPRDELAAALIDFMDNTWQDPETGYWGAWYQQDGEVRKTEDLSVTYHIVAYRQDNPPHLDRMAQTTFAIRNERYPYGWQDRGRQNNHHAYDVVRMLRRAWPQMEPQQQAQASAEIYLMLMRSIVHSMDNKGAFLADPYESVAEAYYFGVSFFDQVGLFRDSQRFWVAIDTFNAEPIRQQIEEHLLALDSKSPMARAALRIVRLRD